MIFNLLVLSPILGSGNVVVLCTDHLSYGIKQMPEGIYCEADALWRRR